MRRPEEGHRREFELQRDGGDSIMIKRPARTWFNRSLAFLGMGHGSRGSRRRRRKPGVPSPKPRVEGLEDRLCLSSDIATGTQAIRDAWIQSGGDAGVFGYPLSSQPAPGAVGSAGELALTQRYYNGLIYWSPETGALDVPYALPQAAQSLFSPSFLAVRRQMLSQYFYDGFIAQGIYLDSKGVVNIDFTDQTKDMGNALVTFSQEASILANHGIDPAPAENVVRIILVAFDALQEYAVQQLYSGIGPGFFVRDFVSAFTTSWRQGVPSDWTIHSDFDADWFNPPGSSGKLNPVMSLDQIVYMMNGWEAVTRYSTDAANRDKAMAQTEDLMSYLISVQYQLPTFNGQAIPDKRGGGLQLPMNAGFISLMADRITGGRDAYFINPLNEATFGAIDFGVVSHEIHDAVASFVNDVTARLSKQFKDYFNFDPVTDAINSISNYISAQLIPTEIDLAVPVALEQGFLDTSILALSPIAGPYFAEGLEYNFSLPALLGPQVMGFLDQNPFYIPTGVSVQHDYFNPDPSKWVTVTLKTTQVYLGPLIAKLHYDFNYQLSTFAKQLALLEMAYDPVLVGFVPVLAIAAGFNDIWAELLPSSLYGTPVQPTVASVARSLDAAAPQAGPATNGPDGWSSKNRWETSGANSTDSDGRGYDTKFNGLDFLSFETLMLLNGLSAPTSPIVFNHPDPGSLTVYEGQTLTVDLSATGGGADALLYSLQPGSPGDIQVQTGNYTWTPFPGQAGTYTVTVAASEDNGSANSTESFSVTVLANNPHLGSFVCNTTSVSAPDNTPINLSVSGVTVPAAFGDSPQIQFYQDTNHDGLLEIGTDQLLDPSNTDSYDSTTHTWTWTGLLAGLSPGTVTLFAQASVFSTNDTFYSNVAQLTLQVGSAPVVPPLVTPAGSPLSQGSDVFYDAQGNEYVVSGPSRSGAPGPAFLNRYDQNGAPIGSPVALSPVNGTVWDVASLPTGHFAVLFSANSTLAVQEYNPDGSPSGSTQSLNIPNLDSGFEFDGFPSYRMAMSAPGQFAVVVSDAVYGSVPLTYYRYSKGSLVGSVVLGGGNATPADVAMDADGNSVVVWNDLATYPYQIEVQRVDASATPVAQPIILNSALSGSGDINLSVAVDELGRFVVAWGGPAAPVGSGIYAQRFLADGTPVDAAPFLVNDNLADDQGRVVQVAFRARHMVIAWNDDTSNTVQGQAYSWDNTLRRLGGNFSIASGFDDSSGNPIAISYDGNGFSIAGVYGPPQVQRFPD